MPIRDPRQSDEQYAADTFKVVRCRHPIWSAKTDDELRQKSLAMLQRYNITAVTSGPLMARWRQEGGKRIIPALEFSLSDAPSTETIRALAKSGQIKLIGELTTQYEGVSPDDPRLEPYWAIAEELDLPVAIHIQIPAPNTGPAGKSHFAVWHNRLHPPKARNPIGLLDVHVRETRMGRRAAGIQS